jgi:hypothetical protein
VNSGRDRGGYLGDPLSWTSQRDGQALISSRNTNGDSTPLRLPVTKPLIRLLRTVPHSDFALMQYPNLNILRKPPSRSFSSDLERSCLSFFLERTGLEISGYFGSSIWSGPVLWSFLSDADTTVPTVVVAVGAAHGIYELDITPRAFEFCEPARSSYAKALRAFNISLNHGSTIHLIVVPLLLYVFELFQDNFETAGTHMNNWLRNLFSLCLQKKSLSVNRYDDPATDESINGLFEGFEETIRLMLPYSCHSAHLEDFPH